MIKLTPNPTFESPVRLTVPDQAEPVEISMTFRHMTAEQVAQWFKDCAEKPLGQAIGEFIAGWSGVMGEDGKLVDYSTEALQTLLKNYQPSGNEIIRAWQLGLTESRVKN